MTTKGDPFGLPQVINRLGYIIPDFIAAMVSFGSHYARSFSCTLYRAAPIVRFKIASKHFDSFGFGWNPHATTPFSWTTQCGWWSSHPSTGSMTDF
jgi:hypothetical protein